MFIEKLLKAIDFATKAHSGQKRKYTEDDYITHPLSVALITATHGGTESQVIAAILHDVVEDTPVTIDEVRAEFGDMVGDIVEDLTDISKPEDGNREARKAIDRDHLSRASVWACGVKLADLIHNTSSICKYDGDFAKVYMREKELTLNALKGGNHSLREYAQNLVSDYFKDGCE